MTDEIRDAAPPRDGAAVPAADDHASLSDAEQVALRHAVDIARHGPAHGPNPQVGCVILSRDGLVLSSGFHRGAGTPHAEVVALAGARTSGADVRGATAVVSLEPCHHTGLTPPCSLALLDAGIARVVYAVADPNDAAAGGAAHLRSSGVDVVGPVGGHDALELVRRWSTAVVRDRPFVTLKIASSLDGRIAAADGTSRWITGEVARRHAHELRSEVDAIVIGTGTALVDNPSLTARTASGELTAHQPLRVVVGHRDVPGDAALHGPGGELVPIATHDPAVVLAQLAARDVRHVLVEGGPTLAAAFCRASLVDEVHAYVAPVLLGAGRSAVEDLGLTTISQALRLETREVHRLGPDVLLVATPAPATRTPGAPAAPAEPQPGASHPSGPTVATTSSAPGPTTTTEV